MMHHQPSLILIIGLIVSVIASGYLWSWPAHQSWVSAKARLSEVSQELNELAQKQRLIKQLEENESTLNQYTDLSLQMIPTSEERTEFATLLNEMASANNVSISGVSFAETKKPDEKKQRALTKVQDKKAEVEASQQGLAFETSVTGEYIAIMNFLQAIEHARRYIGLSSVAVGTGSAENSAQTLRIGGSVYYQAVKPSIKKDLTYNRAEWEYVTQRRAIKPLADTPNPFDNINSTPTAAPEPIASPSATP